MGKKVRKENWRQSYKESGINKISGHFISSPRNGSRIFWKQLSGTKTHQIRFLQHSWKASFFFSFLFLYDSMRPAPFWWRCGWHKRLEVNGWTEPWKRSCEHWAVKNAVSSEELTQSSPVSRSLPVGLSVPCGSFHIQRLVSGPCLEVAGRRVTITIETVHTWRTRYTGQSRDAWTSPLPVSTVLTIARFAWFTCVHKLILGFSCCIDFINLITS